VSDWHKLPRELRDLITEYGNAQHDCGRGGKQYEEYMAGIERVSRARDALTDYLAASHSEPRSTP
jgi:hypothetical protein